MMQTTDLSTPLNDAEIDELDEFLLSVGHDDAILNFSEFDGFMTAIVSGPETIMPSVWIPAMWGGEDNAPMWDSVEDYQHVLGMMMRHMNSTAATLMEAPAEYEPMFLESTVEGVTYWIVDEWCHGYMTAVALYPSHAVAGAEMQEMLAPIRQFANPDGWNDLDGLTHDEIRRLQERIPLAARALHAYWLARRTPLGLESATYVRPGPKVGRNDPCHCGSGRKYKKCCGAH